MKKILALSASFRKLGNCDVLVQEAISSARAMGAEVDLIKLTDLHIACCKGCLSCVFRGKCVITDDDMPNLIAKVLASDGLIIAAPTYFFSPAGIIKRIIDRGLMLSPHLDELYGKKRLAVTFTVAGRSTWNQLGVEFLSLFALVYGFQVIDYCEAYAPGPGEVLLQDKNVQEASRMGSSLVQALDGDTPRRGADKNQCPVCYSKTFRLDPRGEVECPICQAKGKMAVSSTGLSIEFDASSIEEHFWTLEHRKSHQDQWLLKTRDRYMVNRSVLKERLAKYRLP